MFLGSKKTLHFEKNYFDYFGYDGSTLGYVGSSFACIAFASILVNIRRTFRYFGSTLGYVGITLEYIGSILGYSGRT